ncbi:MAG: chloroperoxidase [Phycisphaerae bacterium]|nr:chloroperoxidase [Phycisphaerae bacterium]MBM91671.1 chloroperoxidase [Phycisphaerae bacterium]MBM92584.1 chloroperoxidase [Phycisphaerae bacterium]HCT44676.1 chloroperoxidase [Phycisphaerales bacterium]
MRSKEYMAALLLLAIPAAEAFAQEGEKELSKSQEVGYLGATSRSAMARNVLARLKNQMDVRDVASQTDRVLLWHEIALDSVAIDHTPDPDTGYVGAAHAGPTRTSRALAMTQIAVFDAVNAILQDYTPYNDIGSASSDGSIDAAIAYAAYTVQASLYPEQHDRLTSLLESDLDQIGLGQSQGGDSDAIAEGQRIGELAAQAILDIRADDNSDHREPDFGQGGRVADGELTVNGTPVNGGTTLAFEWEPDPLTPIAEGEFHLALGAYWGAVTPFSLERGDQYRVAPPPTPGSRRYLDGYNEVKTIGASVDTAGSRSTPHTRFIGNFWGYDGTPLLGTPPRSYNQIAAQVAVEQGIDEPLEMARYLAMINTGLADSAIASWDSKFYYNYWRPVTAIPKSDGVDETIEDSEWKPVGISVINTEMAITPTPPFPAYPSGHSTFGSAAFEIMRSFFGNRTRFTFVSDEYNGEGVDPLGVPRPLVPVRFVTLSEAQESNGISRIYNGVHWQWDNIAGQELGEAIGEHILNEGEAFQHVYCLADMDRNGEVGFFDVSEFVRLYGDEDEAADMDANGVFDFFDVSLFLEAYTHGCGN